MANDKHSFEDLITLREAAEISGLSQDYIANLIRNRVLWGTKLGGRNWFTNRSALEAYLQKPRKRGPKKK